MAVAEEQNVLKNKLMNNSRRVFLKSTSAVVIGVGISGIKPLLANDSYTKVQPNQLKALEYKLLKTWCDSLIIRQIKNTGDTSLDGGIVCPSCHTIHGRVGDTVFPFLYLANKTQEDKFLDAAIQVTKWSQNLSTRDGGWYGDAYSNWRGITVFGAIALCEALKHYSHLLDNKIKEQWEKRLLQAVNFIDKNITMKTGNINYPVTKAYAMSLFGEYFDNIRYREEGKKYAQSCLAYLTKSDKLLWGEGNAPKHELSGKGLHPIDLGYNVEESLPVFTQYAIHSGDNEIIEILVESLKSHLEFMMPDGALDNSWGTRNFKWSYWGSRTTDGSQTAFAMLSHKEPVFYKAAYQNAILLEKCTFNGLLHGGPHYHSHGVGSCIQHSLFHSKSAVYVLNQEFDEPQNFSSINLPREENKGVVNFKDVATDLISKGSWRGTITAYDWMYGTRDENPAHASGGAISMLYHVETGPVLVASLSKYVMFEKENMQTNRDDVVMPLTPRIEYKTSSETLFNITCLEATMKHYIEKNKITITTKGSLADIKHQYPKEKIDYTVIYEFFDDEFKIKAEVEKKNIGNVRFYLPLVSPSGEEVSKLNENSSSVKRKSGSLIISSSEKLKIWQMQQSRVFNHVPGMEAIPYYVDFNENTIELSVRYIKS